MSAQSSIGIRNKGPLMNRATKGSLCPVETFLPAVLCQLVLKGGEAGELNLDALTRAVEPILADELGIMDRVVYSNGRQSWETRLSGSKQLYRDLEYIYADTKKGIWRITPRGRAVVEHWLQALVLSTAA